MGAIPTLVTSSWLHDVIQAGSHTLHLLDTSNYSSKDCRKAFQDCHIPGAQFLAWKDLVDQTSPYKDMLPSKEQFEKVVGELGINNDDHVVLYDDAQGSMDCAQRIWWIFRVFGHTHISILEGGLKQWKLAGYETSNTPQEIKVEEYKANFNSNMVKDFDDVVRNITEKTFQLVDARSEKRFKGEVPEPRKDIKSGHIRGSISLFYNKLQDKEAQKIRSTDEIRSIFKEAGVDLDQPITATCGSGVTAAFIVLAAFLCGKEDVSLYDGSWIEFYLRAPPELMEDVPDVIPPKN